MNTIYEPPSYWHATSAPATAAPADLPSSVDVVVVGGGLLGVSTLYWLARAGVGAALLEAATLAAGATGRNAGLHVAGTAESYPALIARVGRETAREIWALTVANRAVLREVLAGEAIDCDYREPGRLNLALDEPQHAKLARTVEALHADGFTTVELVERGQIHSMVGTPLGPEIVGGLFTPENGLLHSARLIQGVAGAAQRHGAQIYEGTKVERLERDGEGLLVRTARGDVRASAAIVAINAWTGGLVPELASLIRPVRGQMLAYEPLPPVFNVGMAASITPTGEYWQQTLDGTIVLGGCRAVAPDGDVDVRVSQPTEVVQSALEQIFPRLFPALDGLRVARRWAGLMAFTPDYLPIVDRVPGLPRAWVVGGFSGHGMPFGMRLGQELAAAATSDATPAALAPFRRDRPSLPLHRISPGI